MKSQNYDLAILGGGLAGLMTAHYAARAGMRVALFEVKTCAQSASAGLVGALAPHMPEHWNDKKDYQFESMKMAAEFWPNVEAETGLNTGYRALGRLQAIHSEAELEKARMREIEASSAWQGIASWTVRSDQKVPFVHAEFGLIYDSLSAQIFPRDALAALKLACLNLGVHIFENETVKGFEAGWVRASQNVEAGAIVIAGGYDAWPLLRPYFGAGFGEGTKGQAVLLKLAEPWDYPMITGDGFYIVPHSPRLLGVGSTSERYWTDRKVDGALEALLEKVQSQIELPEYEVVERWSGIRPRAYRPDPLVGEIERGIYVNAGGFKTGFSFMNKIAFDLVEMILGRCVELPANFDAKNHLQSKRQS